MTNKIVLATGNKGKVTELSQMLAPFKLQVIPQTELGVSDADETGLTFIENAIWHGIQKSSEPEGKITIDYSEDENYFILSVTDNGIGIGNSNREGNSIALKNINERLSLIDANKRDSYLLMEAANPGTNIYLYVAKKSKNHSH